MIDRTDAETEIDMRTFVGSVLQGGYILREFIQEGNFGAVYRSEQRFLDVPVRRVAVKLSKRTGFDAETAKDVFADVFMLAQAMDEMTDTEERNHLVHVYDAGILHDMEKRAFVVMEFVQGTSLDYQFRSYKKVPSNILLKWARQICHALKGLHSLVPPVLHRDLKPDNILLGVDQSVRIIDFGLAAKLLSHGYIPGVAGTLSYMAPETSRGESVPASDVYSVGLILYEGLTGTPPFKHLIPPTGMPAALYSDWLYAQKSSIHPTPPSELNNTVEPELDGVILRCLEFKPERRYLHAGELLQALTLKPREAPPDVTALNEGLRLKEAGKNNEAIACLREGLKISSSSKETRFVLSRELGETLLLISEYEEAAAQLVEAWELTQGSAILRTRKERAELLACIEDAYHRDGNEWQSRRYKDLKERELGRGG